MAELTPASLREPARSALLARLRQAGRERHEERERERGRERERSGRGSWRVRHC
jgi:hypothetical protein